MLRRLVTPALVALASFSAHAEDAVVGMAKPWQLGFQDAATPVMEKLIWIHNDFLLWVITAITVFVLLLTMYIMFRFSRKRNPTPSTTTHNTMIEIIWTVVPILILVAIAIPSLRAHFMMQEVPEADLTIKVTGHQWYWSYEYPDQGGINFDSYMVKDEDLKEGQPRLLAVDNRLVVPVDAVVRVQLTSTDVIHSWAMPAFGVKKDAMPGRLNQTWFKVEKAGTYYGQCSELCGVGHGFMPIEVEAVSREAFDAWVKAKQKEAGITPKGEEKTAAKTAPKN